MRKLLKKALENRAGKAGGSSGGVGGFITDNIVEIGVIAFITIVFISLFGAMLTNEQTGSNNTQVISAINATINAFATIPSWFGILILVIIFVVVITYVFFMRAAATAR